MLDVASDDCLDVFSFGFDAYVFGVLAVVDCVHQVGGEASDHAERLKPVVAVVFSADLDGVRLPASGFERGSLLEIDWPSARYVPLQSVIRDGGRYGTSHDPARRYVHVAACDPLSETIR